MNFISRIFLVLVIVLSSSKSFAQSTEFDAEKFVELASLKFIAEIETARSALQKSTSPTVLSYAKIMINENSDSLSELRTFAVRHHIALSNDVELYAKAHKYIFARKGQSFDMAYTNMRAVERRKIVNLYRSAIKSNDEATKRYATTALPILMRHLYMSQELVQNISSSSVHIAKL